jgi:hypothetical protein
MARGASGIAALLLVLPLVARAGSVDPCPGDTDLDLDGVCDTAADNCPPGPGHPTGVFNPAQADVDLDGRGDLCDNCVSVPNGPDAYAPGLAVVSQCDRDSDGFGNACDADLNNDGFATPLDNPGYIAALAAFIPPPPGQYDLDCNGFMTPLDNLIYLPFLALFLPGPSGLPCAPPPGAPSTTGSCPPLP